MNVTTLEECHFKKSNWSGGSTTELYIFPKNASYIERNFEVRISTAQVEVEKSNFTSLPGVNRKLMILDGEITISHQNHHSKLLKKYEVDSFKGEWNTSAIGTCTDFNVMTTTNIHSDLYRIEVIRNSETLIEIDALWKTFFLYVHTGSIEVELDHNKHHINSNNLMLIKNIETCSISIYAKDHSQLIVVKIK